MKVFNLVATMAFPVAMVACGGSEPPPASAPASSTTAAKPAETTTGAPRVFFLEPKDGDSVKSPVHVKFGSENFMIMAVPEGDVTTPRSGMGHYHIAADADCLPAGSVIPKAAPWTHFGKGTDFYDIQLPPGKHKLTVQAGDDKHTTIEGACQTIQVNVTQ
jgi:hypothetical protein